MNTWDEVIKDYRTMTNHCFQDELIDIFQTEDKRYFEDWNKHLSPVEKTPYLDMAIISQLEAISRLKNEMILNGKDRNIWDLYKLAIISLENMVLVKKDRK